MKIRKRQDREENFEKALRADPRAVDEKSIGDRRRREPSATPRVVESNQIAIAAERCDLPHLATRQTAHPGPRWLLRSFPPVERHTRRPPPLVALRRAHPRRFPPR